MEDLGVKTFLLLVSEVLERAEVELELILTVVIPLRNTVVLPSLPLNNREKDRLRLIGTTERGGANLNSILKPFRTIEMTHLLSVNSSYCSTKWANLPPTGISCRGNTSSGKGWISELCGGRGMFRERGLFRTSTPLRIVFPISGRIGLTLTFRRFSTFTIATNDLHERRNNSWQR